VSGRVDGWKNQKRSPVSTLIFLALAWQLARQQPAATRPAPARFGSFWKGIGGASHRISLISARSFFFLCPVSHGIDQEQSSRGEACLRPCMAAARPRGRETPTTGSDPMCPAAYEHVVPACSALHAGRRTCRGSGGV
jgi:hypothetical protein